MPVSIQLSKILFPRFKKSVEVITTIRFPVFGDTGFYSLLLVGLDRIELSTSPLSGVRSSQLSYRPVSAMPPCVAHGYHAALLLSLLLVELIGIEPTAS